MGRIFINDDGEFITASVRRLEKIFHPNGRGDHHQQCLASTADHVYKIMIIVVFGMVGRDLSVMTSKVTPARLPIAGEPARVA